jgi:transcriptional regulator with XRE-family HTH domain
VSDDVATAIKVLSELGPRVVAKRAERGLSYRDTARLIDVSDSTLWGIEHGRRDPGVIVTLRVLRWLEDEGATWEPT